MAVKKFKIALISMPWYIFDRPSAQLGALKSYLQRQDWLEVKTCHPYLDIAKEIGLDTYGWIFTHGEIGEALYAPLVFPEKYESAKELFNRQAREDFAVDPPDYDRLQKKLIAGLDRFAGETDWCEFDLIGFSVTLSQFFASAAAALKLKASVSNCPPIVFGGTWFVSQPSPEFTAHFKDIDVVIMGEGEKPLLELCRSLRRTDIPMPDRLGPDQLPDLKESPPPDYDDYFEELRQVFSEQTFIPVLPVEFSRGCSWNKCAFCCSQKLACGFRRKSATQMREEVDSLVARYKCLDFAFCDLHLPIKQSKIFFSDLRDMNRDYRFWGYIRARACDSGLADLAQGGLTAVYLGVEALSKRLLQIMGKGVSVIDNISAMKHLLDYGIEAEAGLITVFPGTRQSDIDETMRNLEFVLCFQPLVSSPYYLVEGSKMNADPAAFGIEPAGTSGLYSTLFRHGSISAEMMLYKEYKGDKESRRLLWAPVVEKIRMWQDYYKDRAHPIWVKPPLSYRDGGDFLLVWHEKIDGSIACHRLEGEAREIYLFCAEVRTFCDIKNEFGETDEDELIAFLTRLISQRIVFGEDGRYLALAVSQDKGFRQIRPNPVNHPASSSRNRE